MYKVIVFADIYESAPFLNKRDIQEWESQKSIDFLQKTIFSLGYDCIIVEPHNSKLVVIDCIKSILDNSNVDSPILFNLVEGYGSRNRESYIPALGEFFGIAYTGSDAYSQGISLDKNLLKQIVKGLGVPTKHSFLIENISQIPTNMYYPLFMKPNGEGSSLGINESSIIRSYRDLETHLPNLLQEFDSVLFEEYLAGDDLTLGIFGNYPCYEATKVARLTYPSDIYSEEIKSKDSMPEKLFFLMDSKLEKKIQGDSILICKKLKVSGYARLDWKLDKRGNPFFLEINLTPGLSRYYSSLPICFESNMGNYLDLIKKILQFGYENYNTNKFFNYGKTKKFESK
ncbi:MAG: D-alanine--D-alanine ligase [Leptospiraceae bacterium]|nr:D-alanine--D-alanine ligase [Leptospiraceae bacterium]